MRKKPPGAAAPMIAVDRKGEKPLHRQIYDALRAMILERRLQPGQQIPSSRALADDLGISRIPVLGAYAQLLAEGYIESRSGAGTFVTSSLSDQFLSARPAVTSVVNDPPSDAISRVSRLLPVEGTPWFLGSGAFSVGQIAYDHFPFRVWSDLVTHHARRVRASSMNYADPMGSEEFREVIAGYLRTARAVHCEASQIMVDFLMGHSERIEPFQLQLLCQDVEQRIVKAKAQPVEAGAAVSSTVIITPADLGGEQEMAVVLQRFFKGSLDSLAVHQRFRARELCDTGLLSPAGHRLMLQADQIWGEFGVKPSTLDYLVQKRILREVPRLESIFYEISHDRLAQSILRARPRRIPRKYRVPTAAAAVACILFFVYVLMSIVKLRDERTLANKERDRANQSRQNAEELASYLIGEDLMGSIRPIGKLDVMEGVVKQVDKFVETASQHPSPEPDERTLQIESLAELNRGGLAFQQFELQKARSEFERAREVFARLTKHNGDNADFWYGLADADYRLADVASDQLRMSEARSLCLEGLAAIDRGRTASRGRVNDAPQMAERLSLKEAETHISLAEVDKTQGNIAKASEQFDEVIRISKAYPATTRWLEVHQQALTGKAEVLQTQGDYAAATEAQKSALTYANEAALKSPFEPQAQYDLAIARNKLANLNDKPELTLSEYQKVHRAMRQMTDWDPRNRYWQREYAATLILVADGYREDNQADKALQFLQEAQPKLSALLDIDQTNHDLETDLEWLYRSWGQTLVATGSTTDAVVRFDHALKMLENFARIDSDNRDFYTQWLDVSTRKARALNSLADYDGVLQIGKDSEVVIKQIREIDPTNAEHWATVSILHDLMGGARNSKGDYASAEREYLRSLNEMSKATSLGRTNRDYWSWMRSIYGDLANIRDLRDDKGGALIAVQGEVKAAQLVVENGSSSADDNHELATVAQDLGDRLRDRHAFAEADNSYALSQRALEQAIGRADKNLSTQFRSELIDHLINHVAALHADHKDESGALKAYEAAVSISQAQIAAEPQNFSHPRELAKLYGDIGGNLRQSGDRAAALDYYARAEKTLRENIARADSKEADTSRDALADLLCKHLAVLRAEQKDITGSASACDAAVALRKDQSASNPNNAFSRYQLAEAYGNAGANSLANHSLPTALDSYKHAEQEIRAVIAQTDKKDAKAISYRLFLVDTVAKAFWQIGDAFHDAQDPDQAQASYDRCDQALEYVLQLEPETATYWEDRYVLYDLRGLSRNLENASFGSHF